MMHQLAAHGLFDLSVVCKGDLWIDDHHSVEDVAITLGQALALAVGDKRGLRRFGLMAAPLDEALVQVTLDLSGRPYLGLHGWDLPTEKVARLRSLVSDSEFGFPRSPPGASSSSPAAVYAPPAGGDLQHADGGALLLVAGQRGTAHAPHPAARGSQFPPHHRGDVQGEMPNSCSRAGEILPTILSLM